MTVAQRNLVLDCLDARETEILARILRAEERRHERDLEHWQYELAELRAARHAFVNEALTIGQGGPRQSAQLGA